MLVIKKGSRTAGVVLIIFSLTVIGVSAYVYQQATMTLTQTIVEIATLTLKNSDLGTINEGESLTITSAEVANLGDAISITVTSQPVYLHFDSDVDSQSGSYSLYNINVDYASVPPGGTGSGTAFTLGIGAPDYSSITLDATGTWTFDLVISQTASSVDADTPTTVSIIVSAESTS
jgi:hypothetical protein